MNEIVILVDGVVATSGKLVFYSREGGEEEARIYDCDGRFSPDPQETEMIYCKIEDAIVCGKESLRIEIKGEQRTITWVIRELESVGYDEYEWLDADRSS